MKKINLFFLIGIFYMISIGASAEVYSGSCGNNAKWSLDAATGLLSITGSGNMTDYRYSLDVPWYNYCNDIISLSIEDQITSIGHYAFYNCSGLTSVTIPNSVTSIGEYAFSGCSGLTSVTIGNSVTSIYAMAFLGCNNVKELIYAEGTKTVLGISLTSITSVTIPNSVTSIGQSAFSYCSGLTSVTIPNSVTSIGEWAFNGCSGLTSVTIPNSVIKIGDDAFEDCRNLEEVYVSWSKPITISKYVFDRDKSTNKILISLYVPQGKTKIYESAGVWQDFCDIQEWNPTTPPTPPTPELEGDVNHDGIVDVADITRVAQIILTGKAKEEEELEEGR